RCDRSLPLVVEKIQAAMANLREAEAAEIDRQADKLAAELDAHCVKVNAALQNLTEIEGGAEYMPRWRHQSEVVAMAVSTSAKTLPPNLIPATMPRSMQMAAQLNALREQAAQQRRQSVRNSGRVEGATVDELVIAMR